MAKHFKGEKGTRDEKDRALAAAVAPRGNVFTRFTLRSLRANRVRTVVSIIGIALSCALITAVLTSVVSLTDALIQRTAEDEGWWYAEAAGITADDLDRLQDEPGVVDWTGIADLGTISLGEGEENSDLFGKYLYAKTWPTEQDSEKPLVQDPELVAGHAPEAPGEIVLPHYLQNVELAPCGLSTADGGPIKLGSEVTLDLGTRTVTSLTDDVSFTMTSLRGDYIDDATQSESFSADLGQLSGTVVGFYRSYGYSATLAMVGNAAYVYDDGSALERVMTDDSDATWASVLFRTENPAEAEQLADDIVNVWSRDIDGGSTVHSSLIRWMGATPDTAIWNTLYQIAAILAAVVVVAGVSLVYNSFAISVAERTRQFGLLSSLGASRRQLRRTVLVEALVIGGVGIPVGLALGLLGCFAVFGLVGDGITALFGTDQARVVISPVALGISAALALLTLLVSAWVPALRASHVSAVDAIRQTQDVRLSRRAMRAQRRASRHGDATRISLGVAGRLFGIPGLIAHKNLTRSSSKARVTVAALAVSVALLITSGAIADVMSYASNTAVDTMEGQDLLLYIDATGAEADQTLALADGKVDGPGMQKTLARFYEDARDVEGAQTNGYTTSYVADALVPADMLNGDAANLDSTMTPHADGSWYGSVYLDFVDNTTWKAYVGKLGLDPNELCDPTHPRAIAVNSYDINNGMTYANYQPFTGTGTIESLEFADLDGRFVSSIEDDPSGGLRALYYDDNGDEQYLPYDEAVASEQDIEVGALADYPPDCVTSSGTLQLILPASAIDLAANAGYLRASMSLDTGGDAERANRAQDELEAIAANYPELDVTYTNVADAKLQARLMATTVNTFIFLFAVITGLIAVANVFNTLANALILRRREFAVPRCSARSAWAGGPSAA